MEEARNPSLQILTRHKEPRMLGRLALLLVESLRARWIITA